MNEPTTPYVVRALAPTVSAIEIEGELTRESENALNDAYARGLAPRGNRGPTRGSLERAGISSATG